MNATEVSTPTTSYGCYNLVRKQEPPFPIDVEKKEPRWNYYYKLESESSQDESEGSESTYSVQGKETDLAKDTSDTDWSSEESVLEYEIQSSNDERTEDIASQVLEGDGSSDTEEDILGTTVISITMLKSDDFSSAGSEDSIASTDSEISRRDYWKCVQCKNSNNNPMFRYCEKCYKVRKDLFPPRPKRKRPKKGKKQKYQTPLSINSSNPKMDTVFEESGNFEKSKNVSPKFDFKNIIVPSVNNVSQTQFNHTLFPNLNDKESLNEPLKVMHRKRLSECEFDEINKKRKKDDECNLSVINVNKNIISKNVDMDPVIDLGISEIGDTISSFSQPLFPTYEDRPTKMRSESFLESCKNNIDVIPQNHFSDNENSIMKNSIKKVAMSRQDSDDFESKNCIICMTEPRTGVFVHGRIAHICCCYKCSVKVWTKTKRCPACNCKVSNVLRAFHI